MSAPTQFNSPPQQPGGGSGRAIAIVIVAVAGVSMFCCTGVCAGLIFYAARSKTIAQVSTSIQDQMPASVVANDWMVTEMLTRAYTMALDAVVADKRVIERLGEPIEPNNEPDKLFRRERTGGLSPGGEEETIEFDISGPKGKAIVDVVTGAAKTPAFSYPWARAAKITVKLADGTKIDVPPPKEENGIEP
jgi:hypothetical protein